METINAFSKQADTLVQPLLRNPYLMTVLKVTLVLYAAQIAPQLPSHASKALNNSFVKIILIALIAYLAERDFQLAIILAVVFVLGMNLLAGRGLIESFSEFSNEYTPYGNFKLVEPKNHIYPGCLNVTMADLIKAFDGDHLKLHTTVQYAYQELLAQSATKDAKETLMKMAYAVGLPYNVNTDREENAPYIATLLMYAGFHIGGDCAPPQ